MVGDHTVSFSSTLNTVSESKEEKEIDDRTVPYLIWANYPIDNKVFSEYTSIIDLMPSVLYSAGIELDDYYKQILNLHEVMPGKTSFGLYIDNDGMIHNNSEDLKILDEWNKYLFAEYRRISE